jgi:RND family efflux transporter MFP subunit
VTSVRVLALTLSLWACTKGEANGGAEEIVHVVPVGLATVRRDTISETMPLVGRLAPVPGGSAVLAAPADAVVKAVHAQIGDRVQAGTVLIELDAPELATQARALRAAAVAAQLDADRQRELFAQGITSRRQLEEREAGSTSARSAADAAERLLERTRVTSPVSGGVQRLLVQPGERVSAGETLAEVVNGSALDLHAGVSPAQLARLAVGQPATVTVEGGGPAVAGRVHAIAPAVDSMTGAGEVLIRVSAPGRALRAGSGASARVRVSQRTDALVVPDSALVLVGGTMHVFVVGADSVAHVRPVTIEIRDNGRAAVAGELKPGDRVVTTGAYGLADGMRVIPPAAP